MVNAMLAAANAERIDVPVGTSKATRQLADGQLVVEYVGEVLSQPEAERRGKIYDKLSCSFLFDLDDELVVDATRKGAKLKFANHHPQPNLIPRVMFVDGDHLGARPSKMPGAARGAAGDGCGRVGTGRYVGRP